MFPSGLAGLGAPALREQIRTHSGCGCRHFLQLSRVQRSTLALRLDAVCAADAPTRHGTPRQKSDISFLPCRDFYYSFLSRSSQDLFSFRLYILRNGFSIYQYGSL